MAYNLFSKSGWPPLCWLWAWNKMPKRHGETYNAAVLIAWHDENKRKLDQETKKRIQVCPYCLDNHGNKLFNGNRT